MTRKRRREGSGGDETPPAPKVAAASAAPRRGALAKLRELFSLDLRSLALFRIALGTFLLADLGTRLRYLDLTMTDQGFLPRALVSLPSLYKLSGSYGFVLFLYCVAVVAAVLLLLGLWTRWASLVSAVLLVSLTDRNSYVSDGGDVFAAKLLLWSIFLPLSACWSLEARRHPERREGGPSVFSPATIGLYVEFLYLYLAAGLVKTTPEWHETGTAIEQVLRQGYWAKPAAATLLAHPGLLHWMTPAVVLFETFAPLLLFVPVFTGPIRCIVIVGFWCLQAGLGATIQLNLFPFFSSAATLAFIPAWLWTKLEVLAVPARSPARKNSGVIPPAWLQLPAGILLVALVAHAMTDLLTRKAVFGGRLAFVTNVSHAWRMYASAPTTDFRFRVMGTLANGSTLDLLQAPAEGRWKRVRRAHEDYRVKYFLQKTKRKPEPYHEPYLDWLCREWNADAKEPGRRLVMLQQFVDTWNTMPPTEPQPALLAQHACPTDGAP